jgi:Fe-S cluster assembly ATP-binding protein
MLEINNLNVFAEEKQILYNINLKIEEGKKTVLMGPNGSGKSTICKSLMGDPSYKIKSGKIALDGEDITLLPPDEKARRRIFMVFQEPEEIEGLGVMRFLRASYSKISKNMDEFSRNLEKEAKEVSLNSEILSKNLNVTFSGGEKKKLELLQMILFKPKYALIDEFDSGLDIDSVKKISQIINSSDAGLLIVTHNPTIFKYLKVDQVNIIKDGRINTSGGAALVQKIEKKGFTWTD